jgi:hypothetical protein
MEIDNFKRSWEWVHRMTVDFGEAVPDDRWDFSPDPPEATRLRQIPHRLGDGFAPFSRQLRHVVRSRGVYHEALVTKKADFSRSHEHYAGPLRREALLAALIETQRLFLAALDTFDTDTTIDFGGSPFTFDNFACEMVQHEAIHHGQWSVYASLGGFETPRSWRAGWKM